MATGIAVVDNWVSIPDPRIATQQPYYSNYSAPIRYYQLYSPAGVVWETETLSSWSEWSCDHDGPCCGCDCDCRSEKKDNDSGDRYERGIQNKRGAVSNLFSLYFRILLTFGPARCRQSAGPQSQPRAITVLERRRQAQHSTKYATDFKQRSVPAR